MIFFIGLLGLFAITVFTGLIVCAHRMIKYKVYEWVEFGSGVIILLICLSTIGLTIYLMH